MSSRVAALTALAALCTTPMLQAQEPIAEQLLAIARERVSPIRRCQPADDGSIVVCGDDTNDNRLSPELRDIAGTRRSTRDTIPPAPDARAMTLDKLPYNWIGRKGVLFPRAKPNPLLDHVKAMEAARVAEAVAEGEERTAAP